MAVSIESGKQGSAGRRKDVNADLLLVPYIDLLTCMVAFLLITAVWTQLAQLQVQQKGQGEVDTADGTHARIAILVHQAGFAVVTNQNQRPLPQQNGQYDYAALGDALKRLKQEHPDKTDVQVLSEDPIQFDTLVKTMDAAMASGFHDISLLDAATSAR
jgi:biopolymer transport protein ExbD